MQERFLFHRILNGSLFLLFFFPCCLQAQSQQMDTLHLTVGKAEAIFLEKNLSLIANHFNIDYNKALVEQSKVWDNPVLNTNQTLYDGKFFRHKTVNGKAYGEIDIQLQQIIRTAGKIKKQTLLAADNLAGAEAAFNDLMRNLKFVLTTSLNNLAQLQQMALVYRQEMSTMETLVKGMDEMLKTGDVSKRENIRIKALMFSLQNDYADNLNQQFDLQHDIASMLQLNDQVWVVAEHAALLSASQIHSLSIALLRDSALEKRPDLQLAKSQAIFQQHNINYQKSLAIPDLTIGAEYDHLNSYVPHYYGLAVSLPIPLFNRNKGNIQAAQLAYQQTGVEVQQLQTEISKSVISAWQKLLNATAMLNANTNQLGADYDLLMLNMVNSYQQRQVGLIEFLDFFSAYKETKMKQWQLLTSQRNAAAELNYTLNQNIIQL